MDIKTKPYNLLLPVATLFTLLSLTPKIQNNIFDIHLHDTYFTIAYFHFFWLLAFLTLSIWLIYFVTNRLLLSRILTWIHVIVTSATFILLAASCFFDNTIITPQLNSNDVSWNSMQLSSEFYTHAITIIILIFGQVVFIINLAGGILKRLSKRIS